MALPLPAAVSEHHPFEKNGSSSRLVPLRGEIRRRGAARRPVMDSRCPGA
jgi:hypothetical protein